LADQAPQTPKRGLAAPRVTTVVLLLSLALNIFIAGGYAFQEWRVAHPPAPQPERRLQMLVERLGLDPETSHPFKELRRGLRGAQQVLQAKNHPLGEAYWEELSTPQPDPKHLQSLVDQMVANRHEFQSVVTEVMVQFMATLTQEQRNQLIRIVEDRSNPAGAPVRNSVGN
jgi:Spy/CpxP family protein refolding chaperone